MRNNSDKKVQRRAARIAKQAYRDGLTGICVNPKLLPKKYHRDYDRAHTKGMLDSGQFDREKVA